jgi:hypothetical protein
MLVSRQRENTCRWGEGKRLGDILDVCGHLIKERVTDCAHNIYV